MQGEQEVSRSYCIYLCHMRYLLEKCRCVLPIAAIGENITQVGEKNESHPCNWEDLACIESHKRKYTTI